MLLLLLTTDDQPGPSGPLPARRILEGFRDLGTEPPPAGDIESPRSLACDPSFNRYTAYWVLGEETLDAAYAALDGMRLSSRRRSAELIDSCRTKILSFVASHYDTTTGRFSTNSNERTRGIFAFHTAVGVIRNLYHHDLHDPLSGEVLADVSQHLDTAPDHVRDGLEELIARSRCGDGLVDNPDRPSVPSLTALYMAHLLLWHVNGREDTRGIETFIDRWRLERFIFGCVKFQNVGQDRVAGFAIHPDHRELCVNTTSFALRLMDRLEMRLDGEARRGVEAFLDHTYRDGGFCSTLGEPRSLNATYLGLRALQQLLPARRWQRFVAENRMPIRRFVASCVNRKSSGAAFAADWRRYRENALATRYGLQILQILGDDPVQSDDPSQFEFFDRLFEPDTGGFQSYPREQVNPSGFGPEELESFLDEKDRALLQYHRAQVKQPKGHYQPDTKTIELYDRLVELEEMRASEGSCADELRRESQRVWEQIRQREREEARLLGAKIEADYLTPLREARAELEEMRTSLDKDSP